MDWLLCKALTASIVIWALALYSNYGISVLCVGRSKFKGEGLDWNMAKTFKSWQWSWCRAYAWSDGNCGYHLPIMAGTKKVAS